jgi:hypothetical protein
MPTPRAVPNTLMVVSGPLARAAKARNRMSAADVTRRPVRPIPAIAASFVEPDRSCSSRIRDRMNTS